MNRECAKKIFFNYFLRCRIWQSWSFAQYWAYPGSVLWETSGARRRWFRSCQWPSSCWNWASQVGMGGGCFDPAPQNWSFKTRSLTSQTHFLFPLSWAMLLSLQPKEFWLTKGVLELIIHRQFFNKCLLNTYHLSGPAVSTRNVTGNEADKVPVLLHLLKYWLIRWIYLKYYFIC